MLLEIPLAQILNSVLNIELTYRSETGLLGAIPEFDSMAIVSLITELEDQFGVIFYDDELTAENFETFGAVVNLIKRKLNS